MIHTETPALAKDGTRIFDGYLARPKPGSSLVSGKGPGLLIFSEMWGVAPSKTEMADDYAGRGWCALAPNMFWRSTFTGVVSFDQANKAWERLKAFDWDRAVDDARTAAQWLRAQPFCNGKVAAIGFCMGGRTAFLAGLHAGVDAAISLYALGIAKHLDAFATLTCPTQLHYGLNDEHIPLAELEAVSAAAKQNPKAEVHLYAGAGHGFFTAGRPAFHPQAVAQATARIDALLERLR